MKQRMQENRVACSVTAGEEQGPGGTCSIGPDKRHPGVAVNAKLDVLQ